MIKRVVLVITVIALLSVSACPLSSPYISWQEEVKLNDGRVITVEQKRRVNRGIAREAWVTFNLPEFSSQPIVWHENLSPLVVNVWSGRLYVIAYPPTKIEFKQYGKPRPSYVAFVFEKFKWKIVPFQEIPISIYDTNMLIAAAPPTGVSLLTWERKYERDLNGDVTHLIGLRRIDKTFDESD